MGFLKFLLWTGCAVGLGIFLAKGEVDGRTPLEHIERTWKRTVQPSRVERLKGDLEDVLEDAKDALGRKSDGPRERITAEEREAVNRIIAQKK